MKRPVICLMAAISLLVLPGADLPASAGMLQELQESLRTTTISGDPTTVPPLAIPQPVSNKPLVMTRDLTITSADGTKITLKKGQSIKPVDLYRGNYKVKINGTEVYVKADFTQESPTVATTPPKPAAPPKPTAPPIDKTETGTVKVGSNLNVRNAPWGDIVGSLNNGDKVEIVGRDGTWLKIKHGSTTAFVHEAYVETSATAAQKVIARGTVQVNTDLNVRSGPWGDIIGSLHNNDQVEILAHDGDWLKIKYNGNTAWVHKDYVKQGGATTPPPTTPTTPPPATATKMVVNAQSGLNVRSAPWGAIIGGLNHGTTVTIKRRQAEWAVIEYNGQEAFVHSDYLAQPGTIAPPSTPPVATTPGPGGFTFPVGQFCSFSTRSFSCHARGGSPFNLGVDIFGAIGRPLLACKSGSIRVSVNGLGGNALHVVSGNEDFYYAHLNRFGNVRTGQQVPAGYRVGDLGETGNAAGKNAPHLHFSMVRNGSESVDPTQLLIQSKHGEVRVSN